VAAAEGSSSSKDAALFNAGNTRRPPPRRSSIRPRQLHLAGARGAVARSTSADANGPLVIGFGSRLDRRGFVTPMAWAARSQDRDRDAREARHHAAIGRLGQAVIERDKAAAGVRRRRGVGAGIYDRLNEMGFGAIVRAVNFGSGAARAAAARRARGARGRPPQPAREMWMKSRELLENPRRRDPRPARAAGRRLRADLHLRLERAAQARGQGPHARAAA